MAFNPDQPRDENGEWTDDAGPAPRKRMNISEAAHGLSKKGWQLGAPRPWEPGQKETVYSVIHIATGKVVHKTANQIMRKVG